VSSKHNKHQQRFQFDTLVLDHQQPSALFRQLENQLREAIWSGQLKSGERLPSTRYLAKELSVARNTVVNAYEQLAIEGFIVTSKGSGTRVTQHFPQQPPPSPAKRKRESNPVTITISKRIQHLAKLGFTTALGNDTPARPFRAHTTAYKEFPNDLWAQLTARKLRYEAGSLMEKCHPCGYGPLREAIAGYLGAARGMSVKPEQVMVTAGAQQGIELLAKVLIDPGDVVCFEEPGYTPALATFTMAGARSVSIPVDEQGFNVKKLAESNEKIKLVYVTPSNHFPLGMTLSQPRRKALLQWAEQHNALIVEDDYNGEYRYRGRPLPTLYAMAKEGQAVYIGSFSKLLFPALRLGFIVAPEAMLEPLGTARWLLDRHSPALEQAVLTDFINQGHFARHLRRMRTLYAERQQALVEAAKKYLPNIMRVPPLDGGLHLVGWLAKDIRQKNLLTAASTANIELMPTSLFSTLPQKNPSIILGYAPYSPKQIHHSMKTLRDTYDEHFGYV